nr:MAG TPA: hypothetical protein [Microviridae sp.]
MYYLRVLQYQTVIRQYFKMYKEESSKPASNFP